MIKKIISFAVAAVMLAGILISASSCVDLNTITVTVSITAGDIKMVNAVKVSVGGKSGEVTILQVLKELTILQERQGKNLNFIYDAAEENLEGVGVYIKKTYEVEVEINDTEYDKVNFFWAKTVNKAEVTGNLTETLKDGDSVEFMFTMVVAAPNGKIDTLDYDTEFDYIFGIGVEEEGE